MTAGTETVTAATPAPAGARLGRRGWTAIAAAVVLVVALIATLAVLLAGQGSQIAALRGDVTKAQHAAATAQGRADQASTAAAQAGKTQTAADNANLGVCVDTTYNSGNGASWVSGVTITSPVKSAGGAVSCYSGTFTPVTPQKPPAGI